MYVPEEVALQLILLHIYFVPAFLNSIVLDLNQAVVDDLASRFR